MLRVIVVILDSKDQGKLLGGDGLEMDLWYVAKIQKGKDQGTGVRGVVWN